MNWLRRFKLKLHKRKALVEVCADIHFIETFRAHWLDYNEEDGRSILRREEAKGDKKDQVVINKASKDISEHLASKKELEQLKSLKCDLEAYIDLL